jgi:hypothetical protein
MSDSVVPGTIAHEALQFLRNNPGEVSTTSLANGIGRSSKRLAQHLSPAERAGIFSRRLEGGFAFWRLGPNADKEQAPSMPSFDETDRQRIIKVSALATPSIFAYADQRLAAPFSAALSTDGRLTLERHGRVLVELTNAERVIAVTAGFSGVMP